MKRKEVRPRDDEGFDLTPEEEAEIEAACEEADRGEVIDGDAYLAELERRLGSA